MSCCSEDSKTNDNDTQVQNGCCSTDSSEKSNKRSIDWLLVGSAIYLALFFTVGLSMQWMGGEVSEAAVRGTAWQLPPWLQTINDTTIEMIKLMWFPMALGVFFVGVIHYVPRSLITKLLGARHSKKGVFKATLAGFFLDLCNHGILMVAMKLYQKGASLGQVMAFMISSPWNSFTVTFILFSLVGWKIAMLYILGSLLVAWLSGLVFDRLEQRGVLPANPYAQEEEEISTAGFFVQLKALIKETQFSLAGLFRTWWVGLKGSKMVLRWILFGIVIVTLVRAFVPIDTFETYFGAGIGGLLLTLLAATVIEVCSEGSVPLAGDIVTRAGAAGNGFVFLMAGASTDYTEVMAVKETTHSWKIALFIPLITVPQILIIGWWMNGL